jgi:hypothetical protein
MLQVTGAVMPGREIHRADDAQPTAGFVETIGRAVGFVSRIKADNKTDGVTHASVKQFRNSAYLCV